MSSRTAFALAAFAGAVLRVIEYLSVRTLYLDEAALALNLRTRALGGLVGAPLDFAQTAPVGFLVQQKLLLDALGEHELVLRLVPFLAGLAAIPLFVVLARRLLPERGALVATLLFAVSFYLVYYGGDAKPYMLDVLLATGTLLVGAALLDGPAPRRRMLAYGSFGVLAVWLSQPVVLVLAAVALVVLGAAARPRRPDFAALLGTFAAWGGSGLAAVVLTYRTLSPDHHAYMHDFWQGGFMPLPPRSADDLLWLPFKLMELGTEPLGSMIPGLMALLLLLGIFMLPRLGAARAMLLAMPVLVTLAASAAGEYPFGGAFGVFGGRVVLFLVPSLLLIVGAGAEYLMRRVRPRVAVAILALLVLGNVLRLVIWFPIERTELRPVLAYIAAHPDDFDALYVSYADRHVYEWYAPHLGLDDAPVVYGICATNRPAAYLRDLDRLPPGRAWVTVTHVQPHEGTLMLSYLQRNTRALRTVRAPGARAVLFDVRAGALPGEPPAVDYRVPRQFRTVGCRGSHDWPDDAG